MASVAHLAPDALVVIDPIVPADADRFWTWLDRLAEQRDGRAFVLTTIKWHRRDRDQVAERYGASTSRARDALPDGVESVPIRGAGETMFWLSEPRALVVGDRLLGAPEGGLRLCPESWLAYLPSGITAAELGRRLQPLLDLPVERVLVSHGKPVLSRGHAALEAALAA